MNCGRPGWFGRIGCCDRSIITHGNSVSCFLLKGRKDTMLSLRDCVLALLLATSVTGLPQRDDGLMACGEAFYSDDKVWIALSTCVMNIRTLTNSV